MVFSSLIFVYFFLPLCILFYLATENVNNRNKVLLVFSMIFYGFSSPSYLILMLFMVFISYKAALKIQDSEDDSIRKKWLIGSVTISLLVLAVFKYLSPILRLTNSLTGMPKEVINIVIPVGISFYTFQLISYVVDVYRKKSEAQKEYLKLLLYAGLFFQCVAGPIVRYRDVSNEIENRSFTFIGAESGITRFAIGLGKKVLLANTCGQVFAEFIPEGVDAISTTPVASLWLGMIFYTFQIYFDFSGYSDMAIGMGLMCGFHFRENFNYPYISKSIREFWKRWHISLSSFFRDYVYIPLGGSKKSHKRTVLNLFIVWTLTGIWHGAGINYCLWGIYYFIFITIEHLFLKDKLKKLPGFLSRFYALFVILLGWVIFKFENPFEMLSVLSGMFGLNNNELWGYETGILMLNYCFFLAICILASTPVVRYVINKYASLVVGNEFYEKTASIMEIVFPTFLLALSTMALVGNSYNPFLYFKF
ncbi:alginate O-acetyltransferase complex protein AlgI [Acetitomaculum ruminis DSM 5522]|uniref:Alginate O-acetyltransferase complex protein AlgI n=1 Tax=Acetitomaculum ruminis DSM 5522 TaxID=1120918 RepID=A0A1I0Z504_9FIRM|nr:MBOAT family O-acyltransferase [Acetitomaculum ruminis]SFB20417.1 alginate O-acetyltransferase complex protein AlgI [Acetitomaculum ruminis DSM 5522]